MAITIDSLKFFASERMSDNSDGGGRKSATEIVSGVENSIFDDVSDVDRAVGDCSVRKAYAQVNSNDTDKYLDSGVVVFKEPADPNISVLLTSTGSFYDERADIQEYLETYMVRGPRSPYFLFETQVAGARAITIFCKEEDESPGVNVTMQLIEYTSTAQTTESYSQYVRFIRVINNEMQTFITSAQDGSFTRRVITMEISEPLRYAFHGNAISRYDNLSPLALLYSCVVADAARYYGVRPLTAQAVTGDLAIYADTIYGRIVPTSQVETPILDANGAAEKTFAVPASSSTISFTTGDTFSPNFTLYIGRAVIPGSLSISVSGGTLVDDGGQLKSGATAIGTVNYTDGTVVFSSISPTYTGSKTVTFQPAAPLNQSSNSFGIPITESTRFRTYVANLKPTPNAGTLVVDYMSMGNWYRLRDSGNGILVGAAESYGAGTLNITTGSVSVTLGAYPDLYSYIIFTYNTAPNARVLTGSEEITITLSMPYNPHMIMETAVLTWDTNSLSSDARGVLTGTGGSAQITNGGIMLKPTVIPSPSTVYTLTFDRYWLDGSNLVETFTPTADEDGVISLSLGASNIHGESVKVGFVSNDAVGSEYTTAIANADGTGWIDFAGTIDAVTGTLVLNTSMSKSRIENHEVTTYNTYSYEVWNDILNAFVVITNVGESISYEQVVVPYASKIRGGTTVSVGYSIDNSVITESLQLTGTDKLRFSLSPGTGESIVKGGLQLTIGGNTYKDVDGRMVSGFDSSTNSSTDAGSIDYTTGAIELTDWQSAANSVNIAARSLRIAGVPSSYAIFRTPSSPVAVGSFSFRVNLFRDAGTSVVLEATADASGAISGSVTHPDLLITINAYGRFDYQNGVAQTFFGHYLTAAGNENEPWYNEDAVNGDGDILFPVSVELSSLLYNCVTYTSLPLDSSIIGLDPVRLPADGRVPLFRDGQLVLVHHTTSVNHSSLSPTQVIDCGRVRLYRVTIEDVNGVNLSPEQYTLNRELGTVTMKPTLDLTGLTAPFTLHHTVADLSAISDADLSGKISLSKAVSHTFPANTSKLSGVLYAGTLQARITKLFAQSTWTSVWQDSLIGTEPLAQFNDAQYPIQLTNAGAYPDRILIKFTSATAFQVIGENLGLIGIGDTSTDCSPLNSLTGVAYFTIPYLGWGLGWATGNCLRFNVISAAYPIDLIRAIQPSDPSGLDADSVQLLLIGNIDA